jgi:hypothetical protein
MVSISQNLPTLIVGNSGGPIEHEADQGLHPLCVAPIVRLALDVLQVRACSQ